jgi:Capsule assembly protein Wzi
MQIIKSLLSVFIFLSPILSQAQSAFLPQGAKENIILERLEIKGLLRPVPYVLNTKPYSRKTVTEYANLLDSIYNRDIHSKTTLFSTVDQYNIWQLRMNNTEWAGNDRTGFAAKKPLLKHFYKSKANFFEVSKKDFFLAINPILQVQQSVENGNSERIFVNTRGIQFRAILGNKIGVVSYLTENQERAPKYVQDLIKARNSVPGAGFFKQFKGTGTDYFDARGYITFNAIKHIDFQFGYDRNFIGNGYRSLFLSDIGNNALFLKINTRIWKLNYQNLFMELQPDFTPGGDRLLPKKYAAMHHLNVNVTKWLNVGVFEAVMFGRSNRFDFSYLVPVIFYRSVEQQNGSFDNSLAGLDFKANLHKHRLQFYGQFLLDEFVLSEIRSNKGFWANKWGLQLGAKYIDAFKIKNLDLQLEMNRVRPFTYAHRDSIANYTHYNQPLAHPLGANFQELIAIARYQPAARWMVQAKAIAYQQGIDSSARNFGSSVFIPNVPPFRVGEFGYKVGSGLKATGLYASLLVSYELRQNLYIDVSALYRRYSVPDKAALSLNTSVITAGIRLNMQRREYDY